MIIDKLYRRVAERGFVCVGLDTSVDYIPEGLKKEFPAVSDAVFNFNKLIIDATQDIVAAYKPQIAYYEALGMEGMLAYKKTIEYLRANDLLIIADVKRGDIAATATMYAKAHFTGGFEADFITLNPYMGFDSITPYLEYLERGNKGIFILLRTSNPGAKDIEYCEYNGEPLYYHIGDALSEIGKAYIGKSGYSSLGFVVGGTHSDEVDAIRKRYKNNFFLIPGYGAQGANAKDIRGYLNDFNGGIVNSSRGIIANFKKYEDGEFNIAHYARQAVIDMRGDIFGDERV